MNRRMTAHCFNSLSRRSFLYSLVRHSAASHLRQLLDADEVVPTDGTSPLTPRPGHLPSKAKNCIFLMMEGGPSHIDTFDPKPKLADLHLKEFRRDGKQKSAMESGKRYYVQKSVQVPQGRGERSRHGRQLGASRGQSPTTSASIAVARSTRSIIRPRCTR